MASGQEMKPSKRQKGNLFVRQEISFECGGKRKRLESPLKIPKINQLNLKKPRAT